MADLVMEAPRPQENPHAVQSRRPNFTPRAPYNQPWLWGIVGKQKSFSGPLVMAKFHAGHEGKMGRFPHRPREPFPPGDGCLVFVEGFGQRPIDTTDYSK